MEKRLDHRRKEILGWVLGCLLAMSGCDEGPSGPASPGLLALNPTSGRVFGDDYRPLADDVSQDLIHWLEGRWSSVDQSVDQGDYRPIEFTVRTAPREVSRTLTDYFSISRNDHLTPCFVREVSSRFTIKLENDPLLQTPTGWTTLQIYGAVDHIEPLEKPVDLDCAYKINLINGRMFNGSLVRIFDFRVTQRPDGGAIFGDWQGTPLVKRD